MVTVGFLVSGNEASRQLALGVQAYRDRHALAWDLVSVTDGQNVLVDEYRQRHPDGLMAVFGLLNPGYITVLRSRHSDALVISSKGTDQGPHDWLVRVDDASIGRQAIDHLVRCGYRHFATWGPWRRGVRQNRYSAAEQRCHELGYRCHRLATPRAPTEVTDLEDANAQIAEMIRDFSQPIGIFAHHDDSAHWLRGLCLAHGISVPAEVGIVGAGDDLIRCCSGQPELSSIRIPWRQLGERMAEVLHRYEGSGAAPKEVINLKAYGVHERTSTDLHRQQITDPLVRRFVRMAARAAMRGHGVAELLPKLGCSQPTLYRHVTATLARSPSDYIRDLRVSKACDLLRETDLEVKVIAKRCGFSSAKLLHAAFSDRYPVTPAVWRRG